MVIGLEINRLMQYLTPLNCNIAASDGRKSTCLHLAAGNESQQLNGRRNNIELELVHSKIFKITRLQPS
jgi:hypothetical protein